MTQPLLTLFSAPKSFEHPHIDTIQRNAIQSWIHLGSEVQVLLIGQEPGLAEVCIEYGVCLLSNVDRNHQGTPLVNSIFSLARQESLAPLLAYVNADMLLMPDITEIARQVYSQLNNFLVVGQRWDLEVGVLLDFSEGWASRLKQEVQTRGQLHPATGSDFFIFPSTVFEQIPDFAIGRAGWDNWMIYQARKQGWLVVDATPSLMVVHQNHDYSHLPGGRPHYNLEESNHNMNLAGGINRMYTVLDSDKQLIKGRVRNPRYTSLRLARRLETWLMPDDFPRRGPRWALARTLRRWRRKQTGSLV